MPLPSLLAAILWAFSLTAACWGTWRALEWLRRPTLPGALPGVSILKPLKGCEVGLEENLRSFFSLDYPCFELIFSVAESRDPAVPVVRRLMREYPQTPARLLIGGPDLTANPKVNNLLLPYEQAEHDVCLVSDSNIRVRPDYLSRMVGQLTPEVGVVTAVVAGRGAATLGGRMEAAYLNTFYARAMHVADTLGMAFVLGKSMLFRRSVADRFGGLKALGSHVAEDYMMGRQMRALGLRVAVMPDPVSQFIGEYPFASFWRRHLRWGRIRRAQVTLLFLIEPFQSLALSGVCGAYAFAGTVAGALAFFLAHAAIWSACDLLLMKRLGGTINRRAVGAWLAREVTALPLWLHMAGGSTIEWRGARMKVLPGGLLEAPGGPAIFTEATFPKSSFEQA